MLKDRLRKIYETGDRAAIEDLYAPDALIDVNVVTWRFQRKGIEEIVDQHNSWFSRGTFTILSSREWETPFGSVVENEQTEPGDGSGEVYARQMHVLFTDGDKVIRHIVYCTGPWDTDTVARQKAEAPMYEP
jgi:endo-1,4-beta-mannosidase